MMPESTGLAPAHRAELAAKLIGAPDAVWERVTGGVSTIVYRVTHRDERYYLRILPEDGATFAPEAEAHRRALALGCRVPEVLQYEAHNELLGRSLLLSSEIPGRPLDADDKPEVIASVVREAGRDLARINSIPVESFGWLRRDMPDEPERLVGAYPTLEAMLDGKYIHALDRLSVDAVPGLRLSDLRAAVERATDLLGGMTGSYLAHGDFDTSHIYVDGGRYAGIIDFGEIRGMPPLYDLGHHRMHDRERLPHSSIGWLLAGYREVAALPDGAEARIAAWRLLIAVRALARGLQRSPGSQIVRVARSAILCEALDRGLTG